LGLAPDQQIFNVGGSLVSVNKETNAASVLFQNDTSEIIEVNGQLVAVNPRTKVAVPIFGEKDVAAPEYLILRDNRNGLTTPIDISTATGRAAVDMAKVTNENAGTTVFTVSKMPSDTTPQAKAFQVGTDTVLSYDGGRTYVSADGQITSMPSEGVVPLNDTIAYEVMRAERVRALAGNQLLNWMNSLVLQCVAAIGKTQPQSALLKQALFVMQCRRRVRAPVRGPGLAHLSTTLLAA
jgi:hypothetical protein